MKWFKAILLGCILICPMETLADPMPPVIYVSGSGDGDFNCDGISDQIEINQALDLVGSDPLFTTVYLLGPNSFIIDEPVIISSNTILTGDSSAQLKLKDQVGWWTYGKPMIAQKNRVVEWSFWGDPGDSISNVEIHGFEISGGDQLEPAGNTYVPLIHLCNPLQISIHDMYLHNSCWDIIRLTSPDTAAINSEIHDNLIRYSGHEGICFVGVTDFSVHGNRIYSTRTNTGIRAKNTDNFMIYDNIIGNSLGTNSSGYAGILVENQYTPLMGHAEIFGNLIYGKNGGIHLGSVNNESSYPRETRKDVHIHHNRIFRIANIETEDDNLVLDGGIKINGYHNTLIEHNIIESGKNDGIVYKGESGGESGYETFVRNNIIINNSGFGVNNVETANHSFILDHNLVFGNAEGHYMGCSSLTDIHQNPLFAGLHSTRNSWHHIAATYDNTTETFTIYVDGQIQASQNYPGFGTIGSNSAPLFLGTYREAAYWLEGRLDEVAIWDRPLNSTEVLLLFNEGTPPTIEGDLATDMQAYLRMEGNWEDSSENGFDSEYNTADFTADAISGQYAGLFDGIQAEVQYPADLSLNSGFSISVWTYRTGSGDGEQTILNKGSQEQNNHLWLYFKNESIMFELGNGITRHTLEANIVDPEEMDFHVRSEYGRWNGSEWIQDTVTSPCVDGGDPASDYTLELYPNGGRVNIGLFGNTEFASKSPAPSAAESGAEFFQDLTSLGATPNPFYSSLGISYNLPRNCEVQIDVYNIAGRKVAHIVDRTRRAGSYSASWDASQMPSGMYFVRLKAGSVVRTSKCLLVK